MENPVKIIDDLTDKNEHNHVKLTLIGTSLKIEQIESNKYNKGTHFVTEIELPTKKHSMNLFNLFSFMDYEKFYLDNFPV